MFVINPMNLSELGKTIIKYGAPLLGTAIAGAPGAALGAVVASAFGGDVDDQKDLIQRIVADPQAQIKLAEIESNHKLELERIALQYAQASYADVASARDRQVKIAQAGKTDLMPEVIVGFMLLLYGLMQYCNTFSHSVDKDQLEAVSELLSLGMGFFLGKIRR